jgi:hypothetical protein
MAIPPEPEVPATPLGDMVRAFVERSVITVPEAVVEVQRTKAVTRALPSTVISPALLEHNLARRGIWHTEPDRRQAEFHFATEDTTGSLVIDYSLGQLSVADMRLVAWLLGRWRDDEPEISFSLRRCAAELGVSWKGARAKGLRDQLRRIKGTLFTARVYNAKTKRHEEKLFSIVDEVTFRDFRDRFDGEAQGTTVSVRVGAFVADNIRSRHYSRLDLGRLRSLRSDCAQRLYAYLESQKGFQRGGADVVYEISVDERLQATLGSSERLRRFRGRLAAAGEEICAVDPRYLEISLRPGRARYSWVLSMRRRA